MRNSLEFECAMPVKTTHTIWAQFDEYKYFIKNNMQILRRVKKFWKSSIKIYIFFGSKYFLN